MNEMYGELLSMTEEQLVLAEFYARKPAYMTRLDEIAFMKPDDQAHELNELTVEGDGNERK